jgi:lipoprotein-releasing system permease protein
VGLPWFLAGRLLQRRGTVLLRTSAVAALAAVALGVGSLVVVLALMSGYTAALRSGVMATGGHAVALFGPSAGEAEKVAARARLEAVPGVRAVGNVVYLAGLLLPAGGGDGELVSVKASSDPRPLASLARGASGPLQVAVGRGVARALRIGAGQAAALQVVAGGMPRSLAVRVATTFETGFVELDDHWVVADLGELERRLSPLPGSNLEAWLDRPERAENLRPELEAAAGPGALVTTWQETNRSLFAALRWQKISLALVLSLVLGVGAFEVASALVVMVTEKRRSFGVLMAMGADPGLVRRTLLLVGGLLGAAGVGAGVLLGLAVCGILSALGVPSFPPEIAAIYMVQRIPMRVLPSDLLLVLVLGLAEVLLAALIPVWRASRREPVEVLRWA